MNVDLDKIKVEGEITIKSGDNELKVSLDEARAIMNQLKGIFEPSISGTINIPQIGTWPSDGTPYKITCNDQVNESNTFVDHGFNLRK